jgi:hypothetical protein
MNKAELKKILKPLIKQCIKEVIFEDGTLSNIISEVAKGLGSNNPSSAAPPLFEKQKKNIQSGTDVRTKSKNQKLKEHKKRLLDSIGKNAYNGVDLFEGVTPAPSPNQSSHSPLSNIAPNDPGVDISKFGAMANVWKKLANK